MDGRLTSTAEGIVSPAANIPPPRSSVLCSQGSLEIVMDPFRTTPGNRWAEPVWELCHRLVLIKGNAICPG